VSTSPGSGGSSIADELADLRRQVVFLQGQVEDRDRTIQVRDRTIELLEVNNEVNPTFAINCIALYREKLVPTEI